jgi:hypothetical protein
MRISFEVISKQTKSFNKKRLTLSGSRKWDVLRVFTTTLGGLLSSMAHFRFVVNHPKLIPKMYTSKLA